MPETNKPDLAKLSTVQYNVTQDKHTEMPFSGRFNKFNKPGTYECIVCGQELFKSEHKFDSGCGWPAFKDSIEPSRIKEVRDESEGMIRTEVLCSKCGAHLGHVFNDGPKPTRRRFCINSVSMRFIAPDGNTLEDKGTDQD